MRAKGDVVAGLGLQAGGGEEEGEKRGAKEGVRRSGALRPPLENGAETQAVVRARHYGGASGRGGGDGARRFENYLPEDCQRRFGRNRLLEAVDLFRKMG
ncbi:unnamed protein product [Lampetra planeri]